MAKKLLFCCAGTVGPSIRRVRVKSDLLDETAIEASVVVACTKGSFHKKRCTYFAPSLYFLVKLTRPRLVHCAHAAIRPPTTPTAVWCKCTVPATLPLLLLLLMSLLCHTRTPRLMHFCAFILIVSPQVCPADYYSRKGWHSVILQGTVDHNGLFIDINVGWPGRVHDARVFSNSTLYSRGQSKVLLPNSTARICGRDIPLVLLGDPAYPLLPWVMKAYPNMAT